jgi:hypothetical protein
MRSGVSGSETRWKRKAGWIGSGSGGLEMLQHEVGNVAGAVSGDDGGTNAQLEVGRYMYVGMGEG